MALLRNIGGILRYLLEHVGNLFAKVPNLQREVSNCLSDVVNLKNVNTNCLAVNTKQRIHATNLRGKVRNL